jgi:hypothetical protein
MVPLAIAVFNKCKVTDKGGIALKRWFLWLMCLSTVLSVSGCEASVGSMTTMHGGHYVLKAHWLQGTMKVASFRLTAGEPVEIPYSASVGSGQEELVVVSSSGTIVRDIKVLGETQDILKLIVNRSGTYHIDLKSNQAKTVSVTLDLSKLNPNFPESP